VVVLRQCLTNQPGVGRGSGACAHRDQNGCWFLRSYLHGAYDRPCAGAGARRALDANDFDAAIQHGAHFDTRLVAIGGDAQRVGKRLTWQDCIG
jgi:hypothetical protein